MQIMPETARLYGYDPSRLKEFRYNIRCGVGILKDLLRQFQDPARALAAYYAGENYNRAPSETQVVMILEYVKSVLAASERYEALLEIEHERSF
jgi:soluble lytic murein transglycosylase-like protein